MLIAVVVGVARPVQVAQQSAAVPAAIHPPDHRSRCRARRVSLSSSMTTRRTVARTSSARRRRVCPAVDLGRVFQQPSYPADLRPGLDQLRQHLAPVRRQRRALCPRRPHRRLGQPRVHRQTACRRSRGNLRPLGPREPRRPAFAPRLCQPPAATTHPLLLGHPAPLTRCLGVPCRISCSPRCLQQSTQGGEQAVELQALWASVA